MIYYHIICMGKLIKMLGWIHMLGKQVGNKAWWRTRDMEWIAGSPTWEWWLKFEDRDLRAGRKALYLQNSKVHFLIRSKTCNEFGTSCYLQKIRDRIHPSKSHISPMYIYICLYINCTGWSYLLILWNMFLSVYYSCISKWFICTCLPIHTL